MPIQPPTRTPTERWIPYTLPWDDAPLDLSFFYENEKPAGKHGFLTVQGDRFVFEDGREARFWGTLFNSAANFPSHEYSEKVAIRLAKFGLNMVRLHQMDAEWATPNIFQFTRGCLRDNSLSFDPRSMDRLDYLIHCLKQEGIYIYLDQLSHRSFKTGDGVDNPFGLPIAGAPYSNFDPRLIELQMKFSHDLWNHVNPYTGLAYKDDPAIALTEVANENDLFSRPRNYEPYRSQLEKRYREWAVQRDISLPEDPINFDQATVPLVQFLSELQKAFYDRMYGYLREIGVRIPITGSNWHFGNIHQAAAGGDLDFCDSHGYWDMWGEKRGNNRPLVAEPKDHLLGPLCQRRLLDQPFFASEWDVTWPNEWRATSPLSIAANASLQGWNGLTIHTYRYRTTSPVDRMGAVVLNGVGYRVNFDTFNDPAKFGLFYHAALLFRRGDVDRAKKTVGLRITQEQINSLGDITSIGRAISHYTMPALDVLPEQHRCGLLLPGHDAPADEIIPSTSPASAVPEGGLRADTGQIGRDPSRRIGWIDTPRTKAGYGFLGATDPLVLDGLTLTVKTPFAVIALSSLTDDPIRTSRNLLLTTVGRADNSGAVYNEDHTERLEIGHAPVLVEVIFATIELATDQRCLKVLAIDPEGSITGRVPATWADGKLTFETGSLHPSMYYLIQSD